MRGRPARVSVIWWRCSARLVLPWPPRTAARARARSSAELGADSTVDRQAEEPSAERLTSVTCPSPSMPDHAGRDAGQHRLGEAAAAVDLVVGRERDRCAAPAAAAVMVLKVATASRCRRPSRGRPGPRRRDCPGRHCLRRADQPADRRHQAGWRSRGRARSPSSKHDQRDAEKRMAKTSCTPKRFASSRFWYSTAFSAVELHVAERARVEGHGDVEVVRRRSRSSLMMPAAKPGSCRPRRRSERRHDRGLGAIASASAIAGRRRHRETP